MSRSGVPLSSLRGALHLWGMEMPIARWRAILGHTVTVALLSACTEAVSDGGDRSPSGTDTPAVPTPGVASPAGPEALVTGPVLLLPDPDGSLQTAVVIRPEASDDAVGDTTGLAARLTGMPLTLYSRVGSVGSAELSGALRVVAQTADCSAWPAATITPGTPMTGPWLVALSSDRISAFPLDSLDGVAGRDSAQWAAALTTLASRLPDDTSRTFRSRPYVVDRAWRHASAADTGVIIATLVRRLNQEDAPREERVLLVVDVPGADPRSWRVGWHERAEGEEDALEVAEPLVVFRPRPGGALHLMFGRDDGAGVHAALLMRSPDGWQLRWESARPSCR